MTTIAPDDERLRELDADTRRAWSEYSERLRDLTGEEYERAEHESWDGAPGASCASSSAERASLTPTSA